ncbi:MAG: CPBP family intramembrane metalloprotease [Desulfosarcina sp.]|nr:CPBP family intramembrane metalloprotease [Desulfosarcina sp.]MBC2745371.1 CPBP family intramembrane metalloprotease [Desulfosarcina sp.]MBC2768276.1 CPBP family intramembrane metalloprotease [Desulfosarcina sp.]
MGSAPISTAFLLASLLAVALLEVAAKALGMPLWLLAVTRTAQMLVVMTLAVIQAGGLHVLGLDKKALLPGFKKGLVWSAGFAVVAGLLFLGIFMAGQNPLVLIRSPLPQAESQRVLFFFVGGIVAPVAEEIVFRGLIFGYLRRWGLPAAILISTALFAAIHLPTIPVTQIVGGIVFAVAYHTGKSLMVPIVIHAMGNLAIFTLSLPLF